ncbi:hypothetical protein K2173_014581 [Erythroxylum novogranatense]|uniref:WPP domain-containing protein n=1 Tax=Erythroxylum novogranatense TaxID=1862640 RepID=A0AAV8TGX4_9ROSI|nr:hypothetical protein K2173_014581 [Erythroxylum novogranatense]
MGDQLYSTLRKFENTPKAKGMAETESLQPKLHNSQSPETNTDFALRIWPPSQRTREAVIRRLVETLSSLSAIAHRYGSLPVKDATSAAKTIEEESFSAAASAAAVSDEEDEIRRGIEILQVYSREISKRALEMMKAKAMERRDGVNSSEGTSLS